MVENEGKGKKAPMRIACMKKRLSESETMLNELNHESESFLSYNSCVNEGRMHTARDFGMIRLFDGLFTIGYSTKLII